MPARKDAVGSEAWNPDGIVQVALRDLRDEVGDGSCSWPTAASTSTPTTATAACSTPAGDVDNDATIELYARAAVAQAEAGRPRRARRAG